MCSQVPLQQATVSSSIMNQQCRLCGKEGCEPIFKDKDSPDSKWAAKIKFTLSIEVKITDGSQSICQDCKVKIEEIFEYKREKLNYNNKHFGSSTVGDFPNNLAQDGKGLTPMLMYTMDPMGNFVPIPMMPMMPLQFPNLGSSVMFPTAPLPTSNLPNLSTPCTDIKPPNAPSPCKDSKPPIAPSPCKDSKLPYVPTPSSDVPTPCGDASVSASVEDDDDNVDALIDEVHTDVGSNSESDEKKNDSQNSEDEKSSDGMKDEEEPPVGKKDDEKLSNMKDSIKSHSKENVILSKKKDGKKSGGKKDENEPGDAGSKHGKSDSESDDRPLASIVPSNRARRGVKRKGTSLRCSARRNRPRTDLDESKASEVTTKRSLRARTTQRKIVDSDSDDGDFNPDDPDDPTDPSYSTSTVRKRTESTSSSSSSSSSDLDNDKKNDRSEIVSQILRKKREEKEEALKKSCPTCGLTYKNWASFDDHVKSCSKNKSSKEKEEEEEEKEEDVGKIIKCIVCLKRLNGRKALREHMKEHQVKKEPTYECKTCKEVFPDKGKLICHNALAHRPVPIEPIVKPGKKKLHCEACNEDFENSGDLICHEVLHHKKK